MKSVSDFDFVFSSHVGLEGFGLGASVPKLNLDFTIDTIEIIVMRGNGR